MLALHLSSIVRARTAIAKLTIASHRRIVDDLSLNMKSGSIEPANDAETVSLPRAGTEPGQAGVAYRPEIDGLRAIAAIAVMAYHADLGGARGGFTGVDVFFVISGYLISAVILQDLRTGTFSYREFYLRRALRILPAMLLVAAASLIGVALVIDAAAVKATGQSAIASVAMLANVYFWLKSGGYFGLAAPYLPLIHYWSLAVEEQFYLIVTPMLVLLWARGTTRMTTIIGVAALLSFLLCCYLSIAKPGANYFLLPSRAWELLAGILVRLGEVRLRSTLSERAKDSLAMLGAALLVTPIFLLPVGAPFPGIAALPTITGTCLVVAFSQHDRAIGRVLASPPLVGIGLISYSSYLWHQPLLALYRLLSPNALTPVGALLGLGASVGLGAITWQLVEKPFRRRGSARGIRVAVTAALSAIIVAVGARLAWGPPTTALTERQHALTRFAEPYILFNRRCRIEENPGRALALGCRIGSPVMPSVAIVGDSYATGATAAFSGPLKTVERSALVLTAAGCSPVWIDTSALGRKHQPCDAFSAALLDHIIAHPELRTVVLVAHWSLYLDAAPFDNGEGGIEARAPGHAIDRPALEQALRRTVARLLAADRTVILVYPSPSARWDMPRYLLKRERIGWHTPPLIGISRARVDKHNGPAIALLDSLGSEPRLKRLYPARGLCNTLLPGQCLVARDKRPLYFDDNHLAAEGAQLALPSHVVTPLLRER